MMPWILFLLFLSAQQIITPSITGTIDCPVSCVTSNNLWLPRSFVANSLHELLVENILQNEIAKNEGDNLTFSAVTKYEQNFGSSCNSCKNLGAAPFWSGTNTMTVGTNNGKADLDAYNFGLGDVVLNSDGIAGVIELNPMIQQVGTDFMMHYVHKTQGPSFILKVHAPLGATIVTPNFKELIIANSNNQLSMTNTTSDSSFAYTYHFGEYPTPDGRPASMSEAFFGGHSNNEFLKGNVSRPIRLRKGRISPCKQTIIRLADITIAAGFNLFADEKKSASVAFKISCPTGNVPTGDYMLEPIFGRAGYWGIGAEVGAHGQIWNNKKETKKLTFQLQGEALHLLAGRTPNFRSFDLKQNGKGSKYLLLQLYSPVYTQAAAPGLTYSQTFTPQSIHQAINLTTLPVLSQITIEGSVALMLNYQSNNWSVAFGAQCWGRTKETLEIDGTSSADLRFQNLNDFAVLGRQLSSYDIDGQSSATNPVRPFLCEPLATINTAQNPVKLLGAALPLTAPTTLPTGIKDASLPANRIPANLNDALDIEGAQAAKAITGTVFGKCGYCWKQHSHTPSLALVGSAEFTNSNAAVQFWSVGCVGCVNF